MEINQILLVLIVILKMICKCCKIQVLINTFVYESIEPQTKKTKTLTSKVRNVFVKIRVDKYDKEKCKCKPCRDEYTYANKSRTSHL